MNKRGLSAIIASILIILITVVAITILWTLVLPVVQESIEISSVDSRVQIIISEGHTVYDKEKGLLYVQIKQIGNSDRIEIVTSVEGNSESFNFSDVPGNNQKKMYSINLKNKFTQLGDRVSVVAIPYIVKGASEKTGQPSNKVTLVSQKIIPSENNPEGPNGGNDNPPPVNPLTCGEGEISYLTECAIPISACGFNSWAENKKYVLTQDVISDGSCFNITKENVTLYGNGSKISYGLTAGKSGVYSNKNRTVVQNLIVEGRSSEGGGGFGVYFIEVYFGSVNNVIGYSNDGGVHLYNGGNNTIENINLNIGSGQGILISRSNFNNLINISTSNYNSHGISLFLSNNTFINTTHTNLNTIGINIDGSNRNTLININSSSNAVGVFLGASSTENNLTSSFVCGNTIENLQCGSNLIGESNTCSGECGISCSACP